MTLARASKSKRKSGRISTLLHELAGVKEHLEQLEEQVEAIIRERSPRDDKRAPGKVPEQEPPRPSPLDRVNEVIAATADLRVANGNLSAERMAKLYGTSLSQLSDWLGRTRQAVNKTPDADSLQEVLGFFERVARLRVIVSAEGFRKWLRTPQEPLHNKSPLELLAKGEWQVVADYVDDALSGAPT